MLYVDNRGGTDLVLSVNSAPAIPVPCGASLGLRPGEALLPDLPWRIDVRRAGGGEAILSEQVTELPRWLVQIGSAPPGISQQAVLGPTVTCPPSG